MQAPHQAKIGGIKLAKPPDAQHARRVNQRIGACMIARHSLQGRAVGQVDADSLERRAFNRRRGNIQADDVPASLHETQPDGVADARARTGHQRDGMPRVIRHGYLPR